jgi:RNA polymerase sigma-70 factor (ECF subfamily)
MYADAVADRVDAVADGLMETSPTVERNFAEVYREHHGRVFGLCRYLLRSDDAAQDAAQEVFLRARDRFASYDRSYSLRNWLLKIASNHCIDVLRRRGLETRLFSSDGPDGPEPASGGASPLIQVLENERGADVRRALAGLPEKYRVPLVLAYYNEFTYEEVATALDLPRNTVATLIFRGKQRLRKQLTHPGDDT